MARLTPFLLFLCLISCNDGQIHLSKPVAATSNSSSLIWNYNSPTLRSGEAIPFAFSNGGGSYTTNPFGVGTFDSTTLVYTPPINLGPVNHTIGASDNLGQVGANTVGIAGFQLSNQVDFPLTFGDQNFVTTSSVLDNGTIFIASIVTDTPGWERWVVNKSSDEGLTWQQADHYVPWEDGESHPLAMVNKVNDIYVCGYAWDLNSTNYNTEWIVRKSSDNGTTWSVSDDYAVHNGDTHVCNDITVSPAGYIYSVGFNGVDGGVIRESVDDGVTWSTIGTVPAVQLATVKVSPSGVVWTVATDGHLWKGTYVAGSWNWVDAGAVTPSSLSTGAYQLRGDLELVSETEAYFSGNSSTWKVMKTTDGGTSWTEVYTGAARYKGQDIKKLSTGEIVSIGVLQKALFSNPDTFKIIRSTDDGATWNETYSDATVSKEGITLIETAASVMAFGVYDNFPYQIINLRSIDSGATWSDRSIVYYREHLYTQLEDFKLDSAGNLWATAWLSAVDATFLSPWGVIKSTDNGVNWTNSDLSTGATNDSNPHIIAFGPANEVYVAGDFDGEDTVKKSTDSGATWNIVDTNTGVLSYKKRMTVAGDGTVYYAATVGASTHIRKGTVNGTVWNTIITFPIEPGHTNFSILELNTFPDNSLWIAGTENNTTPANTTVIYRSTDGGASFTEVYRVLESNWYMTMSQLSNGDIVTNTSYKIIRTSDNGATWQDVYDGTALGASIKGFQYDNLGRLYVVNDNEQVLSQNQFDGSWFVVYDYSVMSTIYGSSIEKITDCGNLSEVCLITTYEISKEGKVFQMHPMVVP